MPDGYGLWVGERYWASLTTGGSAQQHDTFFGPVGANTHGHSWITLPSQGSPIHGVQIKDRGGHLLPPGQVGSLTTQPFLRGSVQLQEDGRLTTEIAVLHLSLIHI